MKKKGTAGFTLVELIVVIAIMGILGGVGTVGYSGYVKNSQKKADMTLTSNVVRAIDTAGKAYMANFEVEGQYEKGLQKPVGFLVMSDTPLDAEDPDSYAKIILPEGATNNPLDIAISSAYGEDYGSDLKLQYNAWESGTVASFYEEAEAMIGKVETMGEKVIKMLDKMGDYYNDDGKLFGFQVISQDYNSSDELTAALAVAIAGVDRNYFIDEWATLTQEQNPSGFGLGGREFYSACRGAYSQCFSNYVANAANHSNSEKHAKAIADYGESSGELILDRANLNLGGLGNWLAEKAINAATEGLKFPLAVAENSFAAEANRTSNNNSFTKCKECYDLWKNGYHNSEQARADAAAFYDTMVAATTFTPDPEKPDETLMTWAKKQAKIFEKMYDDVNTCTDNGSVIVVAVYEKEGKLEIQVMPTTADARGSSGSEG